MTELIGVPWPKTERGVLGAGDFWNEYGQGGQLDRTHLLAVQLKLQITKACVQRRSLHMQEAGANSYSTWTSNQIKWS